MSDAPPVLGHTVVAVVVLYLPSSEVVANFRAMVREFGRVIAINNGKERDLPADILSEPGIELISLNENAGIAVALNRGCRRAEELGASWVVTFDQDSMPQPGFAAKLTACAGQGENVAMVGPFIEEAAVGNKARWLVPHPWLPGFFSCVPCERGDLPSVTMVITSGALTSLHVWRELGGFDEALFIDYVDTDFCLRARRAGWRIAVAGGARLSHHLGKRELRRALGRNFFPTHHGAVRHYYIARNRIRMLGRHAMTTPHWLAFECCSVAMWVFRVLAFEEQRWAKCRAMLVGTWDGLLGRYGACRPARLKRLLG